MRSTVLHDVAIQLPITEFFSGFIFSNDPLDRPNFVRQSPSSVQDDIGSGSPSLTCTLTRSSLDCDDLVRNLAPRALLQPPPGLEQFAPPPGLAIDAHLCTTHGTSVTAAPLRPRLRSAISVTPHSLLLVQSMWEHIMHVQLLQVREVLVPLWREPTILLLQILVQGLFLFLNRVPSFFLWSTLVNPNLKGTVVLIQLTVISCIINSVFPFFNGTQDQPAGIPPISLRRPVEGSMRLFFKKPVIMFRTSPISSLRTLATRTSLSCSTRTPLSLTLWCLPSRKTPQAKVRGGMLLLIVRGLLRRPALSGTPTVTFC